MVNVLNFQIRQVYILLHFPRIFCKSDVNRGNIFSKANAVRFVWIVESAYLPYFYNQTIGQIGFRCKYLSKNKSASWKKKCTAQSTKLKRITLEFKTTLCCSASMYKIWSSNIERVMLKNELYCHQIGL